jgi:hypothetical protein
MMTCLTRCGVCRQKREQMLLPVGIRTPLSHPPSRLDVVPVSRYPVLVEVVFFCAIPAGLLCQPAVETELQTMLSLTDVGGV